MRSLILALGLSLLSSCVFAKAQEPSFEITYKSGHRVQKYTLMAGPKNSYQLILADGAKKPFSKSITSAAAEYIKNEATRIIWNSEYRMPASLKKCTEYATLRTPTEKSSVCAENVKAARMSYSLLNSLDKIFKR